MNFKRILAASTACVLAAGSFAACSTKPEEKKIDVEQRQFPKEEIFDAKGAKLEVLTNRTDRVDDGTLDALTDTFEEMFNCTVEYTAYENYAIDALKRMKTDKYGDVLCIPSTVKQENLADYFVSLGTVEELSETYRWANEKKGTDNQVYGIATGGSATGILYNTKIWEQAGYKGDNMPKTQEEFIKALKDIAEKTDAMPYYTNFGAADWTLTQFQSLVNSAAGGADSENELLANGEELFAEGNGYYEVYKFMFDLFSTSEVLEEDHMNTDWEMSKVWFAEGKIGTMVMGSWAIQQFIDVATDSGLDPSCVGYMPAPIPAADGKLYSELAADYTMGVSKNSENQELAKAFVKWFTGYSGYAQNEGMIPAMKDDALPEILASFTSAELFEKTIAPAELDGKFDKIDEKSSLGIWDSSVDGHFRKKIAEAALNGKGEDEFNAIIKEANDAWTEARKEVLGY